MHIEDLFTCEGKYIIHWVGRYELLHLVTTPIQTVSSMPGWHPPPGGEEEVREFVGAQIDDLLAKVKQGVNPWVSQVCVTTCIRTNSLQCSERIGVCVYICAGVCASVRVCVCV